MNQQHSRRTPDSVWIAWLVAFGVLVLLAVNVVRHLTARDGGGGHMAGMHLPASDAVFRAGGDPLGPLLSHRLLTSWQVDAPALAVVAVLAAWYLARVARLRRAGDSWPLGYTLSYLAGLFVCGYATCGAIAVYDKALFTAHMLGHLALVMLAPALLVAGRPFTLAVGTAKTDRLARVLRGPVVSLLTSPPVALSSYTAVIVGSHLTGLMDTIMRYTWVGQVEHLVYLVVGYQFFVLVVADEPIRWRMSTPARWGLLAVAMAVDTFTGVILMMSTQAVHMSPPASLAIDPLSDTRTGGAIMWFGGDAIMAVIMIALVLGWLRASGRTSRDTASWLEQARATTLGERSQVAAAAGEALDEEDGGLAAYNAWLARINAEPAAGATERERPGRS